MSEFLCPRRSENPVHIPGWPEMDHWRDDMTCSYCGSFSPDEFIAAIKAEAVEVGPTDKNYKVYLDFTKESGPIPAIKFYYQHLSKEQITEYIALLNAGKVKIGFPGYLYTKPYFCA